MKNNKFCKFSALVLAAAMVLAMIPVSALAGFSGWFSTWADAEEVSVETQATDAVTQPFASGTGGSKYFRIPAIVTLNDGTIVAAADARWDSTTDGGGLDTIVAYSKDNGATWKSSLANYLGDNGDKHNKASTTFIDPALATDGDTVYMLVDLFPSGYSNTTSATNNVTKTGSGFNSDGTLKLCAAGSSSYDYYLGEFDSDGYANIYDSNKVAINDYKVDQWFKLYKNSEEDGNLFYTSSAYHVYTTQYLYLTKSTDGGETWSAPTLINLKEDKECFYGVCPGSGCITKDGTIIFMCYGCETIGNNLRASYIYSEDDGKTWKRSWDRDTLTFQNCSSEASITEVTVGSSTYLYMFTRYYGTPTTEGAYYFSDDGGMTWTAKTGINYTCSSDMGVITYSKLINDKPAMLLSAHSSSARKSGMIYALTVEENGALTLLNTCDVPGTSSYYAYSDLTELSDGSIGLLYESDTAEITFKKIAICDIVGEDATITEPDAGTTEPEEPTPDTNTPVQDSGQLGIYVTASGVTSVNADKISSYPIEGADEVVAYEMTLNGGDYSGEATVQFPMPSDWEAYDETCIHGFVEETNCSIQTLDAAVDTSAKTITVEVPHFSTVGIYYAAEATSEGGSNDAVSPENTKTVTLYVGEDTTIPDETGNYKSTYTGAGLDTTIATVTVIGVEAVESSTKRVLGSKQNFGSTTGTKNGLITDGNDNYLVVDSNGSISWTNDINQATTTTTTTTKWYGVTVYIASIEANGYYLYVEDGQLKSSSSAPSDNVWRCGNSSEIYWKSVGWNSVGWNSDSYYLNCSSSTWSVSTNSSNKAYLYSYTEESTEGTPASTTITFTGVTPGTTSVVVGNTQYSITVNKKTEDIILTIGGTYTLDNAGTAASNTDSTVATDRIDASGTLTITGVAVGETKVETEKYIVNVTVTNVIYNKNTLVSAADVSYTNSNNSYNSIITGDEITGLLLSYSGSEYTYGTTSFVLKSGNNNEKITEVKVKNESVASAVLRDDGTVIVTGAAVGTCVVEVTFADDSITEVPVRVVQGATSNSNRMEQVYYFDAMYHSEVYYAVGTGNDQVDTKWTKACEGYAIYVQLDSGDTSDMAQESVILLAAKPDDGYAVSTVVHSIKYNTGSWEYGAGEYHFIGSSDNKDLRFGSEFTFNADGTVSNQNEITNEKASYYFDYCYTKTGVVNRSDTAKTAYAYSLRDFESLLNNAADDGLMVGFLYSVPIALRLQVISDKLPTMEKSIKKVNDNNYSEGMTIKLGDKITYTLTFTSYHTHKSTFSSAKDPTISYSEVKYTDELTGDIAEQLSAGLTQSTITKDGATFVSAPGELPMAETKTVDVTFTLSMDNFDKVVDGKLKNVASATYEYAAFQSKGTAAAAAKAEAVSCEITTPTYIVDFGLPVKLDLSEVLGGATISATTATDFIGNGSTLTYTASKPLSAKEYVGLTLKKSANNQEINQSYGVTIIPASNVLYEENFLTAPANSAWTLNALSEEDSLGNQTAEKVGDETNAYGYDNAYKGSTGANGYYEIENLQTGKKSSALTTSFTGTGFDLIGNCGPTTGSVMVALRNAETNEVVCIDIVDTRYNGTDGDNNGVLYQVPLMHRENLEYRTYNVEIYAAGTAATGTNAASAVSTYSVNRTSVASADPFESYIRENNVANVQYIVMNDVLSASAQSVSAVSTYATTADTSTTLEAGTHVEIDAFRVYYPTDNESYNTNEQNVKYMNILDVVEGKAVNWWLENGTYEGEVTAYEGAGGPQNEIYLTATNENEENGQAVTFQISGADSIQVSLRSVDGKEVKVGKQSISSSTEMYYTIKSTDEDGTFTIVNTGTGILGIGNVKIPGETEEDSILTASELDPEVVSYSLRMALAVEPDQPVEPEQPVTFVPETINPSCRSVNVLGRKLVTVSVTASADVAYITVNGQKVSAWNNGLSWIYQPTTLRFTFTDLLKRGESKTYEIVAYNADGVASAVYTVQG